MPPISPTTNRRETRPRKLVLLQALAWSPRQWKPHQHIGDCLSCVRIKKRTPFSREKIVLVAIIVLVGIAIFWALTIGSASTSA
jgi:hypothetical protein